MKTLIVVDMQNDFITGPLGTPEARAIVPKVKAKIEESIRNGDLIIYTMDTHFENYLESKEGEILPIVHCVHGSKGWEVHSGLHAPLSLFSINPQGARIIDKFTFGSKDLPNMLMEDSRMLSCNEIELVGLCTDICVVSNALILKSHFYNSTEITVDASCCAGTTPENHKAALQVMKSCHINVIGE